MYACTVGRDLFSLYHLHLDGLELEIVDDLDCFTRATHIYLQRNRIRIVNTIDDLARLRLLCLADNCIDDISDMGLASLHSLVCLDLSRNKLKQLDTDDLPPYLISLDLRVHTSIDVRTHPLHPSLGVLVYTGHLYPP